MQTATKKPINKTGVETTTVTRNNKSVTVHLYEGEELTPILNATGEIVTTVAESAAEKKLPSTRKREILEERSISILDIKAGDIFRYVTSTNVYRCLRNDNITPGSKDKDIKLIIFNHDGREYIGNRRTSIIQPVIWPFWGQSGRELTRRVVVLTQEEVNNMPGTAAPKDADDE